MSCLIGRGYFHEVGRFGSHIYRNNEQSELLRENHPSSLKSAIGFMLVPVHIFAFSNLLSVTHLRGDEGFRATSRLLEAAKTNIDEDSTKQLPAVNIAFGFNDTVFDWMSRPEEAWRGKRMGEAMQQLHRMANIHVAEGTSALRFGYYLRSTERSHRKIIRGMSFHPLSLTLEVGSGL